jgi:purine-nucleoside phosphorylase
MNDQTAHPTEAASLLRKAAGDAIDCAVVLGSGLADAVAARIRSAVTIPYAALPGAPKPNAEIPGHAGEAIVGMWGERRVLAFSGRVHLYQGRSGFEVAYFVRLAAAAGARTLALTNAAGGLHPAYRVGDLMIIEDQINLTGASPLAENAPGNPFISMQGAYAPRLRALARMENGVHAGVYAGVRGPAYETPAESRFLRTIGADAVGMSTVLETIAAHALGLEVFGVSLITNTVDATATTNHRDVLSVASAASHRLAVLLEQVLFRPGHI